MNLTKQRCEIIKLMCEGYTNKEIARTLVRSEKTIDGHLHKMFSQTGCENRVQLMRFAIFKGIIVP